MDSPNKSNLPDSNSSALHLSHPTDSENLVILHMTAAIWRDALTLPSYFEESSYLADVPLARNKGMTEWVLVEKGLPPSKRPILACCESFRKRCWISDEQGILMEAITHAVASVCCNPEYRGRGYASRLMRELSKILPNWQTEETKCVASILYSDIGKKFYTEIGWRPHPSYQVEFESPLVKLNDETGARALIADDLAKLCEDDETLSELMLQNWPSSKMKFMIVPDHDHMRWHHAKEEFGATKLFGKIPNIKGSIIGEPGKRIWVIWTHRFYDVPDSETSRNTLYILRLVIEDATAQQSKIQAPTDLQIDQFRSIIQSTLIEAAEWKLKQVVLWNPFPLALELINRIGIPFVYRQREEESIPSLMLFGGHAGIREDPLEWIGNEKYSWC